MMSRVILALMLTAVIAVLATVIGLSGRKAPNQGAGSYDMAMLKKTDKSLLLKSTMERIYVPVSNLTAVAVDADDGFCVAGDGAIAIFDSRGSRAGGFPVGAVVRCLAVMPDGNLLVGFSDHVEIYSRDGAMKASWERPAPGAAISSAAVSSNFVFVADYGSRIVWRYDHAGRMLGRIGDKDDERKTGFIIPNTFFDVAAARDGSIRAVNPGLRLVEHFDADGRFLGAWGKTSMKAEGFCGCCNPAHIALMPDGSFVTSEKHIIRVKVYDGSGVLRGVVVGDEVLGKEKRAPDVAVDSAGRILIADASTSSVMRYELKK